MQHILDVMKKMNGVDDDGYETMTVDEAAEMVERILSEKIDYISLELPGVRRRYTETSEECARAIAEALVGKTVVKK